MSQPHSRSRTPPTIDNSPRFSFRTQPSKKQSNGTQFPRSRKRTKRSNIPRGSRPTHRHHNPPIQRHRRLHLPPLPRIITQPNPIPLPSLNMSPNPRRSHAYIPHQHASHHASQRNQIPAPHRAASAESRNPSEVEPRQFTRV